MNASSDYELIDFGDGRKLESLSGYLIDRPSPAALGTVRRSAHLWRDVDASFDEHSRRWNYKNPWPHHLSIKGKGFRLPLRPTPFGHIGAFPEQRPNWQWLSAVATRFLEQHSSLQALNLFAHTGGSTFALASIGCTVAHVDAAKPNVVAAREAAHHCGLGDAPIRYIIDDAAQFAARELRRKRTYDLIVLDPPAYGHSPQGKAWRIERDLWPLIDVLLQLINPQRGAMLVTGHSDNMDAVSITHYLKHHSRSVGGITTMQIDQGRSSLLDKFNRQLDTGFYVRLVCGG